MPGKRETFGLDACTDYTLRICSKDNPCQFHAKQQEARLAGQSLADYMRKDNGKAKGN